LNVTPGFGGHHPDGFSTLANQGANMSLKDAPIRFSGRKKWNFMTLKIGTKWKDLGSKPSPPASPAWQSKVQNG